MTIGVWASGWVSVNNISCASDKGVPGSQEMGWISSVNVYCWAGPRDLKAERSPLCMGSPYADSVMSMGSKRVSMASKDVSPSFITVHCYSCSCLNIN